MTLGKRIRARREWVGMSVEELAQAAGVSRWQVWRWETDAAEPPLSRLRAVATSLRCSVKALLPGEREVA